MLPAPPRSSYLQRVSPRRRLAALLLAIAANVALILMLLNMVPALPGLPSARRGPLTFALAPDAQPERRAAARRQARRPSGGSPPRPTASAAMPRAAPAAPPPTRDSGRLNMLQISPQELAQLDTTMRDRSPAAQAPGTGEGTGAGADRGPGDAEVVGAAPNGEPLYAAEWYREPTDAELSTYLPRGAGPGWGIVACRTVARFHVDDCVELGQSPPGSGYSRAVREAAFQFLVRPPRVGGRSLVGAWVRIRIDYMERREGR